ncbi:hypothetical protein BDB00DRAFT_850903 [Zychaea mexicana]|uniref:uncharacterized protein n=1 Tax=Zychaea mexicana TaxID=64656 RepID=UPI0022FEB925|nr:uncharacterized protein BDB00DRAFT_850903 [Zychaea mexicana]KAI9487974.1 hypothetical protein BDB00DRAFT_850903 [Zychaea mexicana]
MAADDASAGAMLLDFVVAASLPRLVALATDRIDRLDDLRRGMAAFRAAVDFSRKLMLVSPLIELMFSSSGMGSIGGGDVSYAASSARDSRHWSIHCTFSTDSMGALYLLSYGDGLGVACCGGGGGTRFRIVIELLASTTGRCIASGG